MSTTPVLCDYVMVDGGTGRGWNPRWWSTPADAPPGRSWAPCEHQAGHPGRHFTSHWFGDLSPSALARYAERDAARATRTPER